MTLASFVTRFAGRAILGLIGFAALAVFLVMGLDLVETGQWATGQIAVVAAAGVVALISLGTASRYLY